MFVCLEGGTSYIFDILACKSRRFLRNIFVVFIGKIKINKDVQLGAGPGEEGPQDPSILHEFQPLSQLSLRLARLSTSFEDLKNRIAHCDTNVSMFFPNQRQVRGRTSVLHLVGAPVREKLREQGSTCQGKLRHILAYIL